MKEAIGYALAPKLLVDNKLKVRFMYREEPDDASDSGWRFFSGDESYEYVNNPKNIGLYSIETITCLSASPVSTILRTLLHLVGYIVPDNDIRCINDISGIVKNSRAYTSASCINTKS